MSDDFSKALFIYGTVCFVMFIISLYIIRAVFNIPTLLRYHKAQIKLLELLAKSQKADEESVNRIIGESIDYTG